MAKISAPVKKNDVLTGTVMDLTYQAMGVVKVNEHYPIFIGNALPGEEIKYVVTKANKNYAFGRLLEFITTSPDRVSQDNSVYLQTGIAPLAHLSYPAQLKFKQEQIKSLFQKDKLDLEVKPTLAAPAPLHYRNKAQIPVRQIDGWLQTGFYRQHSHQLVPMTDFMIQDPKIDATVEAVRDILRELHVSAYNEEHNSGVIRHIMVRRAHKTGQQMVVLVSRQRRLPQEDTIVAQISELPEVTSIIVNYNPKATNVILGAQERPVFGESYIEDELLGKKFRISAQSFYQVNPEQTENLYQTAIELADLQPDEVVIDAYSGIGTIGISIADHVKQVREIEIVPEAIADAKINAKLNHVTNIDFTVGKAEEILPEWVEKDQAMDVLIVDPPRKGLQPEFIEAVLKAKPKKLVYISCNPATLARDLRLLIDGGYIGTTTQPVDMFPMSNHIESVTALTLA
ncbi:tRNA (uracil-5-)-methyltransferase [Lapidilactobacillus dextrinicus DSM 20335]|uniref:tRNA (Uracil-5-)-methyltransferase n=1 Tax=Lapidilactobacillus dextrinicus DSM 20335 TaxID=1423738 RepID=A0A0R2BKF5_9LACO|nr:23S rRNA (uracil(1939)-C(5))-methyltransferase RlmD [Lapidilactobacillus dextrinicus]KRM80014.1 tRNA (uracil-5-)-methyltransferase [Lapidilactobacillus dextrinicus DSM 20335]QFG46213.1 23S rRNA (uracil(1939)-C(5))-methyltransferase RlmD [Lapidilactobacillus dextrinicus]